MYDLGDTITLSATCVDASGDPADATTVTLRVTLPDGTTTDPTPTNPPATPGQYTYAYVSTQYGRHVVRWVFTGGVPDQAYADVVNVADSSWPALVGLTEVKDHINETGTEHDDELRGFILSASQVAESITGPIARRTVEETFSGGDRVILLTHSPVLSVTSVTENGETVDTADYYVDPDGLLTRATDYAASRWATGVDNIVVIYQAGRTAVPYAVIEATKDLIKVNWNPQIGGHAGPFGDGVDDQAGAGEGQVRLGFFVPNTVMQRLQPSARGPLVA